MQWTPISTAADSLANVEAYSVGPEPSEFHPQRMSSIMSSSSFTTSTDTRDVWRDSESLSAADHLELPQGTLSLSPNPQKMENSDSRRHSDATDAPYFQSSYGPTLWSPKEAMLGPGPLSPHNRSSPSMSSGEYPHMRLQGQQDPSHGSARPAPATPIMSPNSFNRRSPSQPLQSPHTTGAESDAQSASISPTQSLGSVTKKTQSALTNTKGRKTKTKPRRTAHNAIEKRYRIRLNDKIAELRDSIPSLRAHPATNYDGRDDEFGDRLGEGVTVNKVNKANVLEKATEYVKHLESCNRRLEAELHRILNLSRMNELGRQAHSLPSNYAMMDSSHGRLLPRNQFSERCTYPVREQFSGGELMH